MMKRLDKAAREMLNLSHKKRPAAAPLAVQRAASFAKFLRRAQECIEGGHHLEEKAVQIEEEGWGGVPCWKCHTHTSSNAPWGQGWVKCRKDLHHLCPPTAKVLQMIQAAVEEKMLQHEGYVVSFSLPDTGVSRLGVITLLGGDEEFIRKPQVLSAPAGTSDSEETIELKPKDLKLILNGCARDCDAHKGHITNRAGGVEGGEGAFTFGVSTPAKFQAFPHH